MQKEKISGFVASSLALPADLSNGTARIILVGNCAVRVENHDGIRGFRPDEIRVASGKGEIVITGKGLSLSVLAKEELVAEGTIFRLMLHFEEGDC